MQNNDDYETLRQLDEQIKKKKQQSVQTQEQKKLEGAVEQLAKPTFASQLKDVIFGKAQAVYQRTIPTPTNIKKEQERYANPPPKEPIPNKGPRGYGRRLERKFITGAKEIPQQLDKTQMDVSASTYEKIRPQYPEDAIPTMVVSAFGSMRPPPDITTQVRNNQRQERRKRIPKATVTDEQYKELLRQGYSEETLAQNGIVNLRSPNYQEQSRFGRQVSPYRPISTAQAMFDPRDNRHKTPYQERKESGQSWQGFVPDFVGTDENGSTSLFKPLTAQNRMFSPMKPEYVYDAKGNIVSVRQRFFSPPIARL